MQFVFLVKEKDKVMRICRAEDMAKKTVEAINEAFEKRMDDVAFAIEVASKDGNFSCEYRNRLDKMEISALQSFGYDVIRKQPEYGRGYLYEISWNHKKVINNCLQDS